MKDQFSMLQWFISWCTFILINKIRSHEIVRYGEKTEHNLNKKQNTTFIDTRAP